jgi:hypothetical protein
VHVLVGSLHHISFTFAAVDDAEDVSDAIGDTFDAVLDCSDAWVPAWLKKYGESKGRPDPLTLLPDIDPRVQINSSWSIVRPGTTPISIFEA